MARKTAGNSKSPSKQSKSKTDASRSGSAAATDSATQTPRPHSTNTNENTSPDAPAPAAGIGLKLRLLFFVFPLLQMLWTAEAPVRPFSAVRTYSYEKDSETGKEVVSVKKEVIEPRILVVLADVGDVGYVAPTVGILENEPRKEHSTVHVLTLSSGTGEGVEATSDGSEVENGKGTKVHENWAKAWDVLGVQERRRFLVDLPAREGAWNPDVVADTVRQYVVEYNIDTILTFAERGATNDPRRKAVSQGVTSFIHSPRLSEASKNSPNRITPRAFFLRSSVLPFSDISLPLDLPIPLGPLHPVIQHFTLLYRALRKSPESDPDQGSEAGEGIVLPSPPTVFISDIKNYYKSWRAVLQLQAEIGPDVMAKWAVGRDMWVNEWVELEA